jgi:hypothetical protein
MKSAEFIGWALGGLEREIAQTRDRLSALTAEAAKLRARAGKGLQQARAAAMSGAGVEGGTGPVRRRRKMSAEGRKRISDMMTKRWAEYRKSKGKKKG